jgi:hypothetical protein
MIRTYVEVDEFTPSLKLTIRDNDYGFQMLIPLRDSIKCIKHYEWLILKTLTKDLTCK